MHFEPQTAARGRLRELLSVCSAADGIIHTIIYSIITHSGFNSKRLLIFFTDNIIQDPTALINRR